MTYRNCLMALIKRSATARSYKPFYTLSNEGHFCADDVYRWLRQTFTHVSAKLDEFDLASLASIPNSSPLYWQFVDSYKPMMLPETKRPSAQDFPGQTT